MGLRKSPEGPTVTREGSPAHSGGSTTTSGSSASPSTGAVRSLVGDWLRTTDWLWMIVGGFYQIAYLFWYVPALAGLPRSARDPPEQFPWHWPLDFAATALSGSALLLLGFGRATEFARGSTDDGRPRAGVESTRGDSGTE